MKFSVEELELMIEGLKAREYGVYVSDEKQDDIRDLIVKLELLLESMGRCAEVTVEPDLSSSYMPRF